MSKPKRSRGPKIRFSLKAFLILIAIIALPLAWIGKCYTDCQYEARIVQSLSDLPIAITATKKSEGWLDKHFSGQLSLFAYHIELGVIRSNSKGDKEFLQVSSSARGTKIIEEVAKLRHVQSLSYQPMTDLSHLESMHDLSVLDLSAANLNSLTGMENCKKLRKFELFHAENINSLEPLRNMANLTTFRQHLSPPDRETFRRVPRRLIIAPEVIETLPNLVHFEIQACRKVSLDGFRNLRDLRTLVIKKADEIDGFAAFEGMSSLRNVYLQNCSGLKDLDGFSKMQDLEELLLFNCTSLTSVEGIASLPKLKKLRIFNCQGLEDVTPLAEIKSLRDVLISSPKEEPGRIDFYEQRRFLRSQLPQTSLDIIHSTTERN